MLVGWQLNVWTNVGEKVLHREKSLLIWCYIPQVTDHDHMSCWTHKAVHLILCSGAGSRSSGPHMEEFLLNTYNLDAWTRSLLHTNVDSTSNRWIRPKGPISPALCFQQWQARYFQGGRSRVWNIHSLCVLCLINHCPKHSAAPKCKFSYGIIYLGDFSSVKWNVSQHCCLHQTLYWRTSLV